MKKVRWELKLYRTKRILQYRKRSNDKWGQWQRWEIRDVSRFPLALFWLVSKYVKHDTVRRADQSFDSRYETCLSGLTDLSAIWGCEVVQRKHGLAFELRGKRLCEFLIVDRTSESSHSPARAYKLLMKEKDEEALRFQTLEKSKAMLRMALVIYEGRDEPVYVGARTR
jgi:hypothetical protein